MALSALVGAVVLAVPLLVLDLRTPRDFELLLVVVAFAPLYLPAAGLAIVAGVPQSGVLSARRNGFLQVCMGDRVLQTSY